LTQSLRLRQHSFGAKPRFFVLGPTRQEEAPAFFVSTNSLDASGQVSDDFAG